MTAPRAPRAPRAQGVRVRTGAGAYGSRRVYDMQPLSANGRG